MEECFLSNNAFLNKPNGGNFTPREIDIISCILNGGTAKSISKILGISPNTVNTHVKNIKYDMMCTSYDQLIKFVQSSDNYIQIRERYIDLLLFSKCKNTLEKIKALEISPKYKCVIHAKVEEIDKYILLNYLKYVNIKVDISYDSTDYAEDKFHIICYKTKVQIENFNTDTVVISENHNNIVIDIVGKCIESNGSGTQYKSYFSLFGCISKIYSSKAVADILKEFKEYFFNIKDKKFCIDNENTYISIIDKRKTKYLIFGILFLALLSIPIATHLYNEIHKTILTNINLLIGEDIFLRRKDVTSKMNQILEKQKGVKFLVLVGQGGTGKTTLARHYIYTNNAKIKWEINSATEESTIKSFLELAIELSQKKHEKREELKYIQAIEDPEIKKKKMISFVFSQLKDSGKWFLFFDNIDDFKIATFIPSNIDSSGKGVVVITTRNANCGNVSFIPNNSVLDIEYLEKEEKKQLFRDILYEEQYESKYKTNEVDNFLENIPPMPLDISNAAYYIKNTDGSFENYLEILKSPNEETEKNHSKFLNEGIEYNKTRYKMTLVVFDKLIKINPEFKELLLFICLLDSQNISKKYLEQYKKFAIVSDFLQNLKRFFSINLNDGMFSIHKSIQEIGLAHFNSLLTDDEKEEFFKKIIHIMTPYSSILWQKYKIYQRKIEGNELNELEINIKAVINNLKAFHLPISKKNKYTTKLLLAIAFTYGEDNLFQAKHFLNESLKYNKNNEYIENYEYAAALLTLGFAHLCLEEFDDAKLWLNKGLEFCENLKGVEILKAYGLCDLGRCYAKTNEFSKAVILLEEALNIVDKNQDNWACNTASHICLGLSHTYADHYINKNEGYKAISYAQKSLKKLGLEDNIEDVKKSELSSGIVSRWCLAKAYNRIGKHDKVQKYAKHYYRLYEIFFKSDEHILNKALIDIEYGNALLRKCDLISAINIFNKIINAKQKLNDNYYLFHVIVSRIEILIRLNRLDEAYSDFQYLIKQKGRGTDNYTRLLSCTCLYNAFVIKYKQKDYQLSLIHFSDFCDSIKEFCKGFLDKNDYEKLLNADVFKVTKDESKIKIYLQNSIKIFSSIYGKDSSFVKDYATKNLN